MLSFPKIPVKHAPTVYCCAALLAVIYFELVTDAGSNPESYVAVPYIAFIASAFALGMVFRSWYESESGIIEIVSVPLILPLFAAIIAGISYSLVLSILSFFETETLPGFVPGIIFALMSTFAFLGEAWPVLVPLMLLSSILLSGQSGVVSGRSAA